MLIQSLWLQITLTNQKVILKGIRHGFHTSFAGGIFWYVFYLSRDPTRPIYRDVTHIYGRELLAACHHPEQFAEHRYSDS